MGFKIKPPFHNVCTYEHTWLIYGVFTTNQNPGQNMQFSIESAGTEASITGAPINSVVLNWSKSHQEMCN